MRIRGFFKGEEVGAAFVTGTLVVRRLGIEEPLELLVDTGTTRTTISDRDAQRLGIDYSRHERHPEGTLGVGGVVETYVIRGAELVFMTERGRHHKERLDVVHVLRHERPDERVLRIPSILGRDVINRYRLLMDRSRDLIVITDEEIALSQ